MRARAHISVLVWSAQHCNLSLLKYGSSEVMCHTMIKSLEQQSFDISHHTDTGNERGALASFHVELFSSCHLPDDERVYFECETCENWYHPHYDGKGLRVMSQTQM